MSLIAPLRKLCVCAFFAVLMLSQVTSADAQTEVTLHTFTNGLDGSNPSGGLISDGKGNYFGVTGGGLRCSGRCSSCHPPPAEDGT
jgi:hypothetical protein